MRRSCKSQNKKNSSTVRCTSATKAKESEELKNIMTSIKVLQHRVINLPSNKFGKKPAKIMPTTPKMSMKSKTSLSKYYTTSARK